MEQRKEIRPEYAIEIEHREENLTPENLWRMFKELTTQLAERNEDNHFITHPLRQHDFINFDKMRDRMFFSGDKNPVMTCFGPVVHVFYFHYMLKVTVNQFGKWYDIVIDLRKRPFPEEVHKERESGCRCLHKNIHRWSVGGGCLDDGSPRVATICPQCYKVEFTTATQLRILRDRFFNPFVPNWE